VLLPALSCCFIHTFYFYFYFYFFILFFTAVNRTNMLSKVSLFTVGIISVVQTNGEHLRTNTGSKYSGVCACPGTCENGFFTPGPQTCFMKKGPKGFKYCDTKGTTGYCCVNGPAPEGCPGYVPYVATETPHQHNCGQYGPQGTYTCGPSCMEKCQVYQATTPYPTSTEPPMYQAAPAPASFGEDATGNYYFVTGLERQHGPYMAPMMALSFNKRAGCRCAMYPGMAFPKVASICRYDANKERCGLNAGTEICAQAAKQATFGPGYWRENRAHCAGACKPDMALMAQSNGHQEGFTFEECTNQCEAMGSQWSMIDSGSRMLAAGSGCNYDGMEVWSKHM
jgi:hypothetical protein